MQRLSEANRKVGTLGQYLLEKCGIELQPDQVQEAVALLEGFQTWHDLTETLEDDVLWSEPMSLFGELIRKKVQEAVFTVRPQDALLAFDEPGQRRPTVIRLSPVEGNQLLIRIATLFGLQGGTSESRNVQVPFEGHQVEVLCTTRWQGSTVSYAFKIEAGKSTANKGLRAFRALGLPDGEKWLGLINQASAGLFLVSGVHGAMQAKVLAATARALTGSVCHMSGHPTAEAVSLAARSDFDTIVLDEIRDTVSLKIACDLVQKGIKVVASVNANSSSEAFRRLQGSFNLDRANLYSVVKGILMLTIASEPDYSKPGQVKQRIESYLDTGIAK